MDTRIFRVDYRWDNKDQVYIIESRNIDEEIVFTDTVKWVPRKDFDKIIDEALKEVKRTSRTLTSLDSRGIWLTGSRERIVRTVRKDTVTGRYFVVWYGSLIEVKYGQRGGGWVDYSTVEPY